jgi:hypothetical protein
LEFLVFRAWVDALPCGGLSPAGVFVSSPHISFFPFQINVASSVFSGHMYPKGDKSRLRLAGGKTACLDAQ